MSLRRKSNAKRQDKERGKPLGPFGRRICRFCPKEVPVGRWTFCSDECVHEWKIRSNNKYLRSHIYERDLGICASCGVDTRYQKIELENVRRDSKAKLLENWRSDPNYVSLLISMSVTQKESEKSLWHADHVREVADGGGESGLDNYQTLCISCHKKKTKNSASIRRRK